MTRKKEAWENETGENFSREEGYDFEEDEEDEE